MLPHCNSHKSSPLNGILNSWNLGYIDSCTVLIPSFFHIHFRSGLLPTYLPTTVLYAVVISSFVPYAADRIFLLVRTGSDEDITEVSPSSFTSFLVPHLFYNSLFLKPSVCCFLRTNCQAGKRTKEQRCNYSFAYFILYGFGSHL